ncbi:MAG TPA: protein phosphatase 2C domain-containing protein, partial [Myxococcaceae bacterium]|nr:protein phosphatase 2C domain-containing protein [Myxococcaceae bacterium]
MKGVKTVHGSGLAAAVFTSRGPTLQEHEVEYKAYNEDAVAVRFRPADGNQGRPQLMAIGAFDQAGGEGSSKETGVASYIAARCFEDAALKVEEGADIEPSLREAVQKASAQIMARKESQVTTFAAAILVSCPWLGSTVEAYVINVGDSRVAAFDRFGKLKFATTLHNGGAQTHALGDDGYSCANLVTQVVGSPECECEPDLYHWTLESGDWLVTATDGIGDALELKLKAERGSSRWHADVSVDMQGEVLSLMGTAEQGAQALVEFALDQMKKGEGKPDNVG